MARGSDPVTSVMQVHNTCLVDNYLFKTHRAPSILRSVAIFPSRRATTSTSYEPSFHRHGTPRMSDAESEEHIHHRRKLSVVDALCDLLNASIQFTLLNIIGIAGAAALPADFTHNKQLAIRGSTDSRNKATEHRYGILLGSILGSIVLLWLAIAVVKAGCTGGNTGNESFWEKFKNNLCCCFQRRDSSSGTSYCCFGGGCGDCGRCNC
jgi:hypothetical protein